jgi:hypothetical protein
MSLSENTAAKRMFGGLCAQAGKIVLAAIAPPAPSSLRRSIEWFMVIS